MRRIGILLLSLLWIGGLAGENRTVHLKLIETSDIHGNYFPYDFVTQTNWGGGMASVYTYVENLRKSFGDNLLLMDNGDILQGQPSAYYYNYIDTTSTHLCSDIMNYMRYDVGAIGNHDIETGPRVYEKWAKECNFPILCANMVSSETGRTVFQPYTILKREGVSIAILGMITPAIPAWVQQEMWQGYDFEDMEDCARKWVPQIMEREKPDILVGLFHTGGSPRTLLNKYREDAALEVAAQVTGFDVIMYGHDHVQHCGKIKNIIGDSVVVVNPGYNGTYAGEIDITVTISDNRVKTKRVEGRLVDLSDIRPSNAFRVQYKPQFDAVNTFVMQKIGTIATDVDSRQAFFGSSVYVDFIHTIQLEVSGADISFASPLAFDSKIKKGEICVADMFNLYKYENYLYTMSLTGNEVKSILEESYSKWTNTMHSPDDDLILFKRKENGKIYLENLYYLFDSAAGIRYTVDVTKPKGEKINILSMADGSPFVGDRTYTVVVTSYRGSGGGETLIKGVGVSHELLRDRVIATTLKDLRHYMIEYLLKEKIVHPQPLNQWRFIPEEWVKPAAERDYEILFSNNFYH